jgi:hypothetical protein
VSNCWQMKLGCGGNPCGLPKAPLFFFSPARGGPEPRSRGLAEVGKKQIPWSEKHEDSGLVSVECLWRSRPLPFLNLNCQLPVPPPHTHTQGVLRCLALSRLALRCTVDLGLQLQMVHKFPVFCPGQTALGRAGTGPVVSTAAFVHLELSG